MPTKPSYRQAAATIPLLAALLILISAGCSVNEGRITKTGDIPAGYADTTYYIDDNDEPQLAITYRDASLFREGLAVVKNDGNYGYIDDDGEMTLPDIYKSATIFRNGKAWAVRSGSAPGVINRKGETKFTLGQAIEAEIFYEGLARFTAKESGDIRYGFVTDEGETTVPAIYYGATRFSNGLASVEDMNGKWGYINTKGEAVIPATFDAAGTFDEEGYAIVRTDNKYGIIDKNGKYILQPVFEWLEKDGQHYIATREGKYGWSDRKGEWIIEPQYRNALRFFDAELAPVQLSGGRWGYINKKGKIKIKEQFDEAYPFVGNKALVKVGPYYGFINGDGKYVINPGYTWISPDYISNAVNGEPYYTKVQTDLK